MKPFDIRLLKYAASARTAFVCGAILALLRTLAVIAWCFALAQLLALFMLPVLGGDKYGMVADQAPAPSSLVPLIALAVGALLLRFLSGWLLDTVSANAAISVKEQLRAWALAKLAQQSPLQLTAGGASTSRIATILGRGLDALDDYFSAYVPQLLLTAVATPLFMVTLFYADFLSALIVALVFPIIPMFMVLVGLTTKKVQDAQWRKLGELSSGFLDVVSGLSTLKIFGREHLQERGIRMRSESYRMSTMRVLRVSFLSGFVLDLAGTFSVALVAVTVGTRLISGDFALVTGLFVLFLLPETFIPIRQVGVAYHASSEGLAAAEDLFTLVATADAAAPGVQTNTTAGIKVSDLTVRYPGSTQQIGPVSFAADPGEIVVLSGASGSGKSTVLHSLLGFITPDSGAVAVAPALAWAGQNPGLLAGSVASNIALGVQKAVQLNPQVAELSQADYAARISALLHELGLSQLAPATPVFAANQGVSGGQAQRIAIARALFLLDLVPGSALLLDEPTSHLDVVSQQLVLQAVQRRAAAGHSCVIVSHQRFWEDVATRVVRLDTVYANSAVTGEKLEAELRAGGL